MRTPDNLTMMEDLVSFGVLDWPYAGWIQMNIADRAGLDSILQQRHVAIGLVVEAMLKDWLVPGDVDREGHHAWGCPIDEAIERVTRSWLDWRAESPAPGAVAWFDLTEEASEFGEEILTEFDRLPDRPQGPTQLFQRVRTGRSLVGDAVAAAARAPLDLPGLWQVARRSGLNDPVHLRYLTLGILAEGLVGEWLRAGVSTPDGFKVTSMSPGQVLVTVARAWREDDASTIPEDLICLEPGATRWTPWRSRRRKRV